MLRTMMDIRELANDLDVDIVSIEDLHSLVIIKVRGKYRDRKLFMKLVQENCPSHLTILIGREWRWWK